MPPAANPQVFPFHIAVKLISRLGLSKITAVKNLKNCSIKYKVEIV